MKTHIRLLLISLTCFVSVHSQILPGVISCSTQNNADGSISIIGDCTGNAEYTVKIIFTTFSGYTSSLGNSGITTVYKGKREIARLVKEKSAYSFVYSYRYQYFTGRALRKMPDTSFVYLLPVTEGRTLTISHVTDIAEAFGRQIVNKFISTGFYYQLGDTICATRAGTVYQVSDTIKKGEKKTELYNKERNSISIMHKDGTLGHYSILAPIQLLVQDGDNVVPGQPIAVFNKESERYTVLFHVSYLDEKKLEADKDPNIFDLGNALKYTFLPLLFYSNTEQKPVSLKPGRLYNSLHPKEIVGAELSKKEKKKLGL